MALLTPQSYPAVRAAIDVGLSVDRLPDAVIELPIYAGAAELEVLARDPDAATRTGTDAQYIQQALIYLTAARLIVALPQIVSESSAENYRYQVTAWDANERAVELRSMATAALDVVLSPTITDQTANRPTMFAAACGRRGR